MKLSVELISLGLFLLFQVISLGGLSEVVVIREEEGSASCTGNLLPLIFGPHQFQTMCVTWRMRGSGFLSTMARRSLLFSIVI